jgi:hypothetical protein
MRYTDTYDYDVLLLEVNPTLYTTLQRLFPRGNIFHVASTRLFSFSQTVQQAVAEYGDLSGDCIVGVHIRARKRFPGNRDVRLKDLTWQFASIVKSMAGNKPGNIFVAADADALGLLSEMLPGRTVWWNHETQESLRHRNAAGNPGSHLSAFVDLLLVPAAGGDGWLEFRLGCCWVQRHDTCERCVRPTCCTLLQPIFLAGFQLRASHAQGGVQGAEESESDERQAAAFKTHTCPAAAAIAPLTISINQIQCKLCVLMLCSVLLVLNICCCT